MCQKKTCIQSVKNLKLVLLCKINNLVFLYEPKKSYLVFPCTYSHHGFSFEPKKSKLVLPLYISSFCSGPKKVVTRAFLKLKCPRFSICCEPKKKNVTQSSLYTSSSFFVNQAPKLVLPRLHIFSFFFVNQALLTLGELVLTLGHFHPLVSTEHGIHFVSSHSWRKSSKREGERERR